MGSYNIASTPADLPTVQLSELATAILAGTEQIFVNQGGTTLKTTTQAIADLGGATGITNLSYITSASNGVVASDTGTNATLPLVTNSDAGLMSPAQNIKLAGIEASATADQTGAEIKALYEAEANTNAYTDAEKSKLAGLESSKFLGTYVDLTALQAAHPSPAAGSYAHVDAGVGSEVAVYIWDNDDSTYHEQAGVSSAETAASIKTKYESNADTNAFSDAEKSKLAGITDGATPTTVSTTYDDPAVRSFSKITKTGDDYEIDTIIDFQIAFRTATTIGFALNDSDGTARASLALNQASDTAAGGFPAAAKVKLDNVEANATANPNAIESDTANEINAITNKPTPVSADVLLIEDSEDSFNKKHITVGSLPTGGGGEANTTSNAGAGEGLAKAKSGVDLPFKSLVGGTNVTLSSDADTVTIAAAGGGGATNLGYTASPTNGTVTSDTGDDAIIPLADGTNAGLLPPADKTAIDNLGNLAPLDTVGTSQISDNAVTFAKMQDIATGHLIGRSAAGSGDPEQLSATQTRSLLNVEDGATANATDAALRDRATHTGTQLSNTISDFDSSVSSNSAVTANTAKVSADGSVTSHSDVSDAGSGAIITTAERDKVNNAVESKTAGEPSGSDVLANMVSLTQAEYDAGTPVSTTFYIITDAV